LIFVDTSAWFAYAIPDDEHHEDAVRWVRQNRLPLVTTDYIIDKTLTLLQARAQTLRATQLGELLFGGNLAQLRFLRQDNILSAWQVFRQYTDKDWSFTDCTSRVVMEELGITQAFSFDQHFRQFGTVAVLP